MTTKWYTKDQIASAVKRGFLKERTSLATRPAHVGSIATTCPHPRVHVHAPLPTCLTSRTFAPARRPACYPRPGLSRWLLGSSAQVTLLERHRRPSIFDRSLSGLADPSPATARRAGPVAGTVGSQRPGAGLGQPREGVPARAPEDRRRGGHQASGCSLAHPLTTINPYGQRCCQPSAHASVSWPHSVGGRRHTPSSLGEA